MQDQRQLDTLRARYDSLTCADLIEAVGRGLVNPDSPQALPGQFGHVLGQSKEILTALLEVLRLAVTLGEIDDASAGPELALLEELLRPLLDDELTEPGQLALVYFGAAAAFRSLRVPIAGAAGADDSMAGEKRHGEPRPPGRR